MNAAVDHYDRNAESLALRYDSLRFDTVHRTLLPYLPSPPAKILDIGAGSGRDAIALAEMGFRVTAVEPAARMLRQARHSAGDARIEWVDDQLPALKSLAGRESAYAFILCSAVLMHLDKAELLQSFTTMRRLLTPKGALGFTVRSLWSGDAKELFHSHPTENLVDDAAAAGLTPVLSALDDDYLGRQGLRWRTMMFARDIPS